MLEILNPILASIKDLTLYAAILAAFVVTAYAAVHALAIWAAYKAVYWVAKFFCEGRMVNEKALTFATWLGVPVCMPNKQEAAEAEDLLRQALAYYIATKNPAYNKLFSSDVRRIAEAIRKSATS